MVSSLIVCLFVIIFRINVHTDVLRFISRPTSDLDT